MIQPEPKGSTQGYPLVSVEVFRKLKDGGEDYIFFINIDVQENQGPTMDECHEKLKSMRFQHSKETIHNCFHEVLDNMLVFSEEGAVGALDGTLIHASVLSHKQNVYRARGRGDCYQNVLAICDFNMIFTYIVSGWEGTEHDARILKEALDDPIYEFPIPPSSI
nr:hypothetical protein [Tanacetum cinerariifolium]